MFTFCAFPWTDDASVVAIEMSSSFKFPIGHFHTSHIRNDIQSRVSDIEY